MRKIIIFLSLIYIISCSKNKPIEQVNTDLRGMFENKVEVENLEIKRIIAFSKDQKNFDSVYFDCKLLFIDDLFSNSFKFNKGMEISVENNIFIYDKSSYTPQLIKLEFGNVKVLE